MRSRCTGLHPARFVVGGRFFAGARFAFAAAVFLTAVVRFAGADFRPGARRAPAGAFFAGMAERRVVVFVAHRVGFFADFFAAFFVAIKFSSNEFAIHSDSVLDCDCGESALVA